MEISACGDLVRFLSSTSRTETDQHRRSAAGQLFDSRQARAGDGRCNGFGFESRRNEGVSPTTLAPSRCSVTHARPWQIIVTTDHLDKHGHSKIKQHCTLPLTGSRVVSRIITNLCVFDVDRVEGILTLLELADGITVEDVRVQTEATFVVAPVIGRMESED